MCGPSTRWPPVCRAAAGEAACVAMVAVGRQEGAEPPFGAEPARHRRGPRGLQQRVPYWPGQASADRLFLAVSARTGKPVTNRETEQPQSPAVQACTDVFSTSPGCRRDPSPRPPLGHQVACLVLRTESVNQQAAFRSNQTDRNACTLILRCAWNRTEPEASKEGDPRRVSRSSRRTSARSWKTKRPLARPPPSRVRFVGEADSAARLQLGPHLRKHRPNGIP